ncbi:nucleotidyl transferase AbiEii/AbiGii toxin family protein [Candidatus Daviesbacteria bacterium]|nr:nucleotidyl transferase AbiEii/AbiGii toxin family protein [Candidatus Daviesbacteria bacterium]
MGNLKRGIEKPTFTPLQKYIFDEFSQNNKLTKKFYFTGGTALSAIYFHHRESEDLDFFSDEKFENEEIESFINKIALGKNLKVRFTQKEVTKIFELLKGNKAEIKVDFACYPYKRIKKGPMVNSVRIDSKQDIAINKLHTITSRMEVKDFVDLYFLLKEFSFWDLFHGVEEKFRIEIDLLWLGMDFLKVEEFKFLPKMLVPLSLKELQDFYRVQAKKLGRRVVK